MKKKFSIKAGTVITITEAKVVTGSSRRYKVKPQTVIGTISTPSLRFGLYSSDKPCTC